MPNKLEQDTKAFLEAFKKNEAWTQKQEEGEYNGSKELDILFRRSNLITKGNKCIEQWIKRIEQEGEQRGSLLLRLEIKKILKTINKEHRVPAGVEFTTLQIIKTKIEELQEAWDFISAMQARVQARSFLEEMQTIGLWDLTEKDRKKVAEQGETLLNAMKLEWERRSAGLKDLKVEREALSAYLKRTEVMDQAPKSVVLEEIMYFDRLLTALDKENVKSAKGAAHTKFPTEDKKPALDLGKIIKTLLSQWKKDNSYMGNKPAPKGMLLGYHLKCHIEPKQTFTEQAEKLENLVKELENLEALEKLDPKCSLKLVAEIKKQFKDMLIGDLEHVRAQQLYYAAHALHQASRSIEHLENTYQLDFKKAALRDAVDKVAIVMNTLENDARNKQPYEDLKLGLKHILREIEWVETGSADYLQSLKNEFLALVDEFVDPEKTTLSKEDQERMATLSQNIKDDLELVFLGDKRSKPSLFSK